MDGDKSGGTILIDEKTIFLSDLPVYLDVLGSDVRLRILKFVATSPKDIREISNEIETSLENTKRHLDKLMSIGILKQEAGKAKTGHLVWKYYAVKGWYKTIMLNIAQFANIKFKESDNEIKEKIMTVKNILSKELIGKVPVVFVLDGVDDGKYFTIDGKSARIGRQYSKVSTSDPKDDIVLSNDYAVVTRVNQPHALLTSEDGNWYVEDSSMNGTFIDNKRLDKYKKVRLKNGDIIELGKGLSSVRLLFALPGDS